MRASVAAGGGLLIAFSLPSRLVDARETIEAESFSPDGFIRIDPYGRVTVIVPQVEMGQGTFTSCPMLIAEELEVALSEIQTEQAPPDGALYSNSLIGSQVTGGSTSIRAFYEPLRKAGATAREMLIAAAATTWSVEPSSCRAESGNVIHEPSGRKLGYGALAEKAAMVPVPEEVALKEPSAFKLIGTPAKRLDTPDKVNGKTIYGIDAKVPGMKIATLAICPVFGGKLKGVDASKALQIKNVLQVVQTADTVAVVATNMGAAKKGLAALEIEWDAGPNAKLTTSDIVADMAKASEADGVLVRHEGDVPKALEDASQTLEAIYEVPFLAHTTMEPLNCTVHVREEGCDIWVGTQVIGRAQAVAAELTGLPPEKVVVHNHMLGGGFGRRLEVDFIAKAVEIAKQVDGPVKLIWSREEDIQHDLYRPSFYDRLHAGLDSDGMPVAWSHRICGSSVIARWASPAFKDGYDFDTVDGALEMPYAIPNVRLQYVRHEPPGIPTGFWRSVGPSHNIFVVESFIDECAAAANKDPLEYRRALLAKAPRALAVLELAAEKAGWGEKLPERSGRGIAVQNVFASFMAQVAEVEVSKSGEANVKRVTCAVDCGVVINPNTIEAQVQSAIVYGLSAALFDEITLKDGRVEQSNFHDYRALHMNEMPSIDIHIVKSDEAPGGMGEPGTSALVPAVFNAVYAATGVRLRRPPLKADHLKV
ncbi:xanthine dehydrogenase family protein molybdopterin-binding subunit [Methyloceanibacter sp.]|uniref:xanthine dehydrogenase family protein molybdopterin-binding subunit n=1 Tax=Methyloceanibacter sp. TaxID=1965321 RepID=UPI002C1A825A|nr:xanthine dehydrogenase family protein molybdopterin-binding subunit [Methyloceanibacter sp.]HML91095.1 xanthine dehydrogenase family protein molybdopterin-binding subunit [Methyloceanibacter sp.]